MRIVIASAAIGALVAASGAAFAVNFPEVEGNNTKAAANVFTLNSGDTVTGTVASSGDGDYFRLMAPVNATKAIYLHNLALSGGSGGQYNVRGLAVQSGGNSYNTVAGSDNQTLLPSRISGDTIKWYDFGNGGGIDIKAQRTSAGSNSYTMTHTVTTINAPIVNVNAGLTNIQTKYLGDGEIFLYDSSFNLVGQNDNRLTTGLGAYSTSGLSAEIQNFNLVAGNTYYVAIGNGNTTTSTTGDSSTSSPFYDDVSLAVSAIMLRPTVLDLPGVLNRPSNVATSVSGTNQDYSLWINGALAQAQTSTINGQEVAWYALNVVPTPGSAALLGLAGLLGLRRRRA